MSSVGGCLGNEDRQRDGEEAPGQKGAEVVGTGSNTLRCHCQHGWCGRVLHNTGILHVPEDCTQRPQCGRPGTERDSLFVPYLRGVLWRGIWITKENTTETEKGFAALCLPTEVPGVWAARLLLLAGYVCFPAGVTGKGMAHLVAVSLLAGRREIFHWQIVCAVTWTERRPCGHARNNAFLYDPPGCSVVGAVSWERCPLLSIQDVLVTLVLLLLSVLSHTCTRPSLQHSCQSLYFC